MHLWNFNTHSMSNASKDNVSNLFLERHASFNFILQYLVLLKNIIHIIEEMPQQINNQIFL